MERHDEYGKLFKILSEEDLDLVVYVYRIDSRGKHQKPYLCRTYPHAHLPETLRDQYGGGNFYLMIREGNRMVYSGAFSVWGPRMRV
jgi:hypothetical protein